MIAWVHPNIHRIEAGMADVLSVKVPGEHMRYAALTTQHNVTFKVHESGRLRSCREGVKNVHAWTVGELDLEMLHVPACFKPTLDFRHFSYDYRVGYFYDMLTGVKMNGADEVLAHGKVFYYRGGY